MRVPTYLEKIYWWAYVRPWAISIFERQWLVNAILFGNYKKLRDVALSEYGTDLSGRTLQISCCYGNLSPILAERVTESGGMLDVVDILPNQLDNLRRKIPPRSSTRLICMDSAALELPDATYDWVLLFFLLHEQPQKYRENTMREALRVLKPNGNIVIVDYANPPKWHPVRLLMFLFLAHLEPYAVPVWNRKLIDILPKQMNKRTWEKKSYFFGLYQKLVSTH